MSELTVLALEWGADFLALAANFNKTDATWPEGDFDGSGTVDFADFVILADNFGSKLRDRVV